MKNVIASNVLAPQEDIIEVMHENGLFKTRPFFLYDQSIDFIKGIDFPIAIYGNGISPETLDYLIKDFKHDFLLILIGNISSDLFEIFDNVATIEIDKNNNKSLVFIKKATPLNKSVIEIIDNDLSKYSNVASISDFTDKVLPRTISYYTIITDILIDGPYRIYNSHQHVSTDDKTISDSLQSSLKVNSNVLYYTTGMDADKNRFDIIKNEINKIDGSLKVISIPS